MRRPEYISPSALSCFEASPEEYYMRYLADTRPPKFPQTEAMAVGSAFDAYIKSFLHDAIYGKNHAEAAKYQLRTIFDAQVESQHRDQMFPIGAYLFSQYKASGALSDLMIELQGAVDDPRFEFEVKGVINGSRESVEAKKMGVPLLGKPDIRFINNEGAHVIFDWKVNGYFSKASPLKGYLQCRDQLGPHYERKGCHKDAMPMRFKGIEINMACYLEDSNSDWATQLATYGWLLGEEVGVENVVGVDQLVCNSEKPQNPGNWPHLRVASHRSKISSAFQFTTLNRYLRLWGLITDEPFYFFRDRSFEDSKAHCALLDGRGAMYSDPTLSAAERWTLEQGRK